MNANNWSAAEIWTVAADRLKQKNELLYRQWFQNMTPLRLEENTLTLGVSDDFFASIIRNEYDDLMIEALQEIAGSSFAYRMEPGHSPAPAPAPAAQEALPAEPTAAPAEQTAAPAAPARPVREKLIPRPGPQNCLAEHTFENFIVGAENRYAFAAARTAAEEPGVYNPLYLYGASGVGKTHLDFYNLLQQHKSLSEFRSSVRGVDVLLVDDIHSLAKKTQMQEEFFNLFNTLYSQHKQIILTSDRQPCEISDIDKRLESRFESGMTAEVGAPEYEARLAILRMWRSDILSKAPLGDEFLEFLAANISSNVRRLKGAFIRLASYASFSGNDKLTLEQAEELLHSQLAQESAARDISIESIQRAVAGHFGITLTDILGEKRTRTIAEPRMIAMFLCRELTSNSSTEIGEAFGRNHATILHAEKKVPQLCSENEIIRRSITQLKRQLQRG